MVRVGAYCIRLTNSHDNGKMIDPPDTCWDAFNTPLLVRDKYLIPIYRMNIKPGTCCVVCNTPLSILDKHLINMYLLNPIPGKD